MSPVAAILSAVLSLHHIGSWCMMMLDYSGWFPYFGICPRLHANFGSRLEIFNVDACVTIMVLFLTFFSLFQVPGCEGAFLTRTCDPGAE